MILLLLFPISVKPVKVFAMRTLNAMIETFNRTPAEGGGNADSVDDVEANETAGNDTDADSDGEVDDTGENSELEESKEDDQGNVRSKTQLAEAEIQAMRERVLVIAKKRKLAGTWVDVRSHWNVLNRSSSTLTNRVNGAFATSGKPSWIH